MRYFRYITFLACIMLALSMQVQLLAKINPAPTEGVRPVQYREAIDFDAINPEPISGAITINSTNNLHYYALSQNIMGPLVIDDNAVTLDLNGYCIYGSTNGIQINPSLKLITIYNGSVVQCTKGIYIDNDCSTISLHDIAISSCSNAGILIAGNSSNYCANIGIAHVRSTDNTLHGIHIDYGERISLTSCSLKTNGVHGLLLDNSNKVAVNDCIAQENYRVGFALYNSSHNNFRRCKAVATINDDDSAYGFYSEGGTGNVFDECYAEGTETESTSSTEFAVGFGIFPPESNDIIQHCTATRTIAPDDAQAYGILLNHTFDELKKKYEVDTALVFAVAWHPSGEYLAVGLAASTPYLQLYHFDKNTETLSLIYNDGVDVQPNDDVLAVAWSPDGNYLAVGKQDTISSPPEDQHLMLYVFNRSRPQLELLDPTSTWGVDTQPFWSGTTVQVNALDWSPDGDYVAVGGGETSGVSPLPYLNLYKLDRTTPQLQRQNVGTRGGADTQPSRTVHSVSWHPEGGYLAISGLYTTTYYWDLYAFNTALPEFQLVSSGFDISPNATPLSIAWSPDGGYLAAGTLSGSSPLYLFSFDQTIPQLQNVASGVDTQSYILRNVAWSPEGKYLAASGGYGTTITLDVYAFNNVLPQLQKFTTSYDTPPAHRLIFSAWSPSGSYFAAGNDDGGEVTIYRGLNYPQNCIIRDNLTHATSGGSYGTGIEGENVGNAIFSNRAYDNDRDYGTAVYHVHKGYGLSGLVENISLSNP